jgi:signal transduction histidine kinase
VPLAEQGFVSAACRQAFGECAVSLAEPIPKLSCGRIRSSKAMSVWLTIHPGDGNSQHLSILREFAERHKVEIDFRSDVLSAVPLQVGLPLFRVLQEALNNAIKHSGVKRIEVQLRKDSGEIHLVVSDLGRGFDLETAMHGRGLGLTSIRERVRLVNGTIEIQSKPMGGTTIHVRVPLESKQDSQRQAV